MIRSEAWITSIGRSLSSSCDWKLALDGRAIADEKNTMAIPWLHLSRLRLQAPGLCRPHRVYCNGDHLVGVTRFDYHRCGLDDFTALVLSAVGTDAVRHFRFVAVRALGMAYFAESVVRAAVLCASWSVCVSDSAWSFYVLKYLLKCLNVQVFQSHPSVIVT